MERAAWARRRPLAVEIIGDVEGVRVGLDHGAQGWPCLIHRGDALQVHLGEAARGEGAARHLRLGFGDA